MARHRSTSRVNYAPVAPLTSGWCSCATCSWISQALPCLDPNSKALPAIWIVASEEADSSVGNRRGGIEKQARAKN